VAGLTHGRAYEESVETTVSDSQSAWLEFEEVTMRPVLDLASISPPDGLKTVRPLNRHEEEIVSK